LHKRLTSRGNTNEEKGITERRKEFQRVNKEQGTRKKKKKKEERRKQGKRTSSLQWLLACPIQALRRSWTTL
jgi:hypothetical protein